MHSDSRSLPDNTILEGDLCIVGAGTAGISIALDWINSPYKVILLEAGGFEYDDRIQDMYAGKTTGQRYFPLRSSRLHYFGGTTGHWAGFCSPYDPIDFQKRDWVPYSGWPISRESLDPFYARAQEKLQLGPYEYDLSYWQKEVPNLHPMPLDEDVVWNKMWQFNPARFNPLYREKITSAGNIFLYTYAKVTNILANENLSQVSELTVKNLAGKTHTVKAKHVILACGAIQDARLLLASNSQMEKGLGNYHDLVGRYFMEHLEIASAELWLFRPLESDLYALNFGVTKARAELAITAKAQAENRILNGTSSMESLARYRSSTPIIDVWQNEDPRESRENLSNRRDVEKEKAEMEVTPGIQNAYNLFLRMEQAPNPDSRVTIGPEKDELGVPRANLHWALTSLDKRSIGSIYRLLGQQVGISGIGRVRLNEYIRDEFDESWPEETGAGWHHMGTTRMHDDPKEGVVNPDCQVHGLSNLYVAGSACFTTAGAANPTLTLVALSLRLSDHVKERMKKP